MPSKVMGFVCAFVLASAVSASAQVERVAMRTTGISCGSCAAVAELNLHRLVTGVDEVTISMAQEAIMVAYEPGAPFELQPIRDVLNPLEVGILQLQISARGQVLTKDQGMQRTFVAGEDSFVLKDNPSGPTLPLDTLIVVEGVLNDQVDPMQLKILGFSPVTD